MEAFFWMFKKEEFKQHFSFLCFGTIILFIMAIIIAVLLNLINVPSLLFKSIIVGISILVFLLPLFFPLGYMWELTGNIINRDFEIVASNVYNGKVKEVYNIELPKLNLFRFIWRGFASFVANFIMLIPYTVLIYVALTQETMLSSGVLILLLSVIFYFLLPGVLWNYAKQNSIFAVLNVPKAIFLAGNYTFRYLKAILLFLIIYFLNIFIDSSFVKPLYPLFGGSFDFHNIPMLIGVLIALILGMIKTFYLIYVSAYILGTIVPTQEG